MSFFFLAFFGLGWYQPFFSIVLGRYGYPGWQIGLLAAVAPAVALGLSPFWGHRWDVSIHPGRILRGLALATAVVCWLPGWSLTHASGFVLLAVALALLAASASSIAPLGTAATLASLSNPDNFGRLRQWGSLGFFVSASIGMLVYQHVGSHWLFVGYGASLATGALLMPVARKSTAVSPHRPRASILSGPVLWLLLAVFLTQLANAGGNTVLGLYYEAHLPLVETGWPWAWTALLEVPVFLGLPRLLSRLGPARILMAAMTLYTLRIAAYPFVHSLWAYLLVASFQAGAFAGFYGGQVALMDRLAPRERRGRAQSILASWGSGLASLLGAVIGGSLFSLTTPTVMFLLLAASAAAGSLVFLVTLFRRPEGAAALPPSMPVGS